jgi:hypothetical protein
MEGGFQHREAAFLARLPDPGGLRRDPHRNRLRRFARYRLRVSAGCSTAPHGVTETAEALIATG